MGIWHPKLATKKVQKRIQNRDPENLTKTVICVLKNGVRPVRESQKWLKNDSKNARKKEPIPEANHGCEKAKHG